jgi:hypothetical protein
LVNLRQHLASKSGKLISSILLISILLNNILIPELERFHFGVEIEGNSAGLIEILVENAVDSDLFETDEHDDSSDNLVDSIQKFLNNTLQLEIIKYVLPNSENQSIFTYLKLAKGFLNIDTPPPKLL